MHWGYGMGGGMMIFWLVLAIALIALVVWAIMHAVAPPQGRVVGADDILRERYARGEITREQFEQMRDDLRR